MLQHLQRLWHISCNNVKRLNNCCHRSTKFPPLFFDSTPSLNLVVVLLLHHEFFHGNALMRLFIESFFYCRYERSYLRFILVQLQCCSPFNFNERKRCQKKSSKQANTSIYSSAIMSTLFWHGGRLFVQRSLIMAASLAARGPIVQEKF